jgi:hypothetical protein
MAWHPVRTLADRGQLAPLLQATFGRQRHLRDVARLPGASKKGVYRATFEDESSAIVYIWSDAEDYWPSSGPEGSPDHADPFSHASGLDLLEAACSTAHCATWTSPRLATSG